MDKRFFVEKRKYNIGEIITIEGEEHKHLSLVLRLKVGDTIDCLPNDNTIVVCNITSINKNKTQASVIEIINQPNSVDNVDVFVGNLKGDKNEFLIQKLSELGVNKITFFESKFVTAKLVKDKSARNEKIALTSAKQCKRNKAIEIGTDLKFKDLLKVLCGYDKVLVAYENEKTISLNNIELKSSQKIAVVIGSEGGFAREEIDEFINNGYCSISLGERILKAETAGVVFTSLVMFKLGELGK